jgi:hypothetical protein
MTRHNRQLMKAMFYLLPVSPSAGCWKILWRRLHGGAKCRGHFGVRLKGRDRMWRSEWTIRSFMSHGAMLAHMLCGPLSRFRPRRSGSTLRAEGLSRDSIREYRVSVCATDGGRVVRRA